jgi:pimeloyl-ACP methyl ester carboxylesterase
MANWTHRFGKINGINMHWVEEGEGPLVILAHGFPHLWFSWRHQIPAIAAAGWRVVAPDIRGMGQTDAPADPSQYDCDHTVGDMLGLLDHYGEEQAVFAGLDFGVFAEYDLAFRHPERVRALIGLENPVAPHNPAISPLNEAREIAKQHFLHITYFEPHGPADEDMGGNVREFLTKVYYALSGDYHYLDVWKHPPGTSYRAALPEAPPLPWPWLSEVELEFFVQEYSRTGFTGGLNWYRAMDLRWEQRKRFEGQKNPAPFFFIGSENDVDLEGFHGDDPLGQIKNQYADVRAVEMISHAGHMVQMERAQEVNALMLKFLATLKG